MRHRQPHNKAPESVVLPLPPTDAQATVEMDIYVRFMRHLRCVPTSRMEIKILTSIQFVSDMTGSNDGHVAKVLVDCGLRAPRMAFPAEFLDFCDLLLTRDLAGERAGGFAGIRALKEHWDDIGEDRFVSIRRRADYRDAPHFMTTTSAR